MTTTREEDKRRMSVFKRGRVYWYKFRFNGRLYQRTTNTNNRQKADRLEQQAKEQLHQGWSGLEDRKRYKSTLGELLVDHVAEYKVKHKTGTWTTEYGAKHLTAHLGEMFIVGIDVDRKAHRKRPSMRRSVCSAGR
jgi:hypothetical protein